MTAFKKKTAFRQNLLPKYQGKISDVLKIKKKIGTNLYITENMKNGAIKITPADQIIKTKLTLKNALEILNEKYMYHEIPNK